MCSILSFQSSFNKKKKKKEEKLASSLTCCLVVFFADYCLIKDLSTWTTVGKGEVKHGLYHLLRTAVSPSTLATDLSNFFHANVPVSASVLHNVAVSDLWHCHQGHLHFLVYFFNY